MQSLQPTSGARNAKKEIDSLVFFAVLIASTFLI